MTKRNKLDVPCKYIQAQHPSRTDIVRLFLLVETGGQFLNINILTIIVEIINILIFSCFFVLSTKKVGNYLVEMYVGDYFRGNETSL